MGTTVIEQQSKQKQNKMKQHNKYKTPGLSFKVGDGKIKHDLQGKFKCTCVTICKILIKIYVFVSSFSFSLALFTTRVSTLEHGKVR